MSLRAIVLLFAFGMPAQVPTASWAQSPVESDLAHLYEGWWRLVQITSASSEAIAPEAPLTARFTPDGPVGGIAGPNSWSGSYTATRSGRMRMKRITTDLIGGLEAARSGEYLKWMLLVRSFEVTPSDLRLKLSDSRVLLFQREPIGWAADRGRGAVLPFASEEHFTHLARVIPGGLGGVLLTGDVLNVYLKDLSKRVGAQAVLKEQLKGEFGPGAGGGQRGRVDLDRIKFHRGRYDFAELGRWRGLLIPHLDSSMGMVPIDIDERANRIEIGVREDAIIPRVRKRAAELGIPTDALSVVKRAPVRPAA